MSSRKRERSRLREILKFEKNTYIDGRGTEGGSAPGWRRHIGKFADALEASEPVKTAALNREAFIEAAMRTWETVARKVGPDLFSGREGIVPEYLTRPASNYDGDDEGVDCGDDETEERYEKVHQRHATVADLYADATIKMRKAAQSSAAAEKQMRLGDEFLRRAGGDMAAFLRDIVNDPERGGK